MPRESSEKPTLDRLGLLTFLWAAQSLVHHVFFPAWLHEGSIVGWVLTVVATAALLRPGSVVLFVGLITAEIAANLPRMPDLVNHMLVVLVVDFVFLASVLWSAASSRSRSGSVSGAERRSSFRDCVVDRATPVAFAALVICYGFAFLSKLNTDFLDPSVSCVSAMYDQIPGSQRFWPKDDSTIVVMIYMTIAVEGLIPLGLILRRTRPFAIALGTVFHLTLGWIGHWTFSAFATAVYGIILLAPLCDDAVRLGLVWTRRLGPARSRRFVILWRLGTVAVIVMMFGKSFVDLSWPFSGVHRLPKLTWLAWTLILSAWFARVMWHTRSQSGPGSISRVRPGPLWIAAVLVALNGITPYIGSKTQISFTMYSNLRTEGGQTNHLFLPRIPLFDDQDDLVEILRTDHPLLSSLSEDGLLLTYFEFRRLTSRSERDFEVVYARGGKTLRFERRGGKPSDAELATPHPWWLERFLRFRPVEKEGPTRCLH